MFQAFYIIQMLDTGEFIGQGEDGQVAFFMNLAHARTFQNLQNALNFARDIDPGMHTVTVHTVYLPCTYQPSSL